jgi:hypothetical protein
MGLVREVARWVIADFGPLIMFWILDLAFGLKIAIAGSVLFILGDALWRWRTGVRFTRPGHRFNRPTLAMIPAKFIAGHI